MKSLIALVALSVGLQAGTMYRPMRDVSVCVVSGVANTTPARITLVSSTACGAANGQKVFIDQIWNTGTVMSGANSNPDGGSDNHIVRTLATVSGQPNQWDLYAADGTTAVVPGGTYSYGGFVYRVEAGTTPGHPTIYLDGPSGTVTAGLQNAATWGNTSRPEIAALTTRANNWIADPKYQKVHADRQMAGALACALKWYSLGKPGGGNQYETCAKWGLINDALFPTHPCAPGSTTCAFPESSYFDAQLEYAGDRPALLKTLMWESLSAGEKTAYLNKTWDGMGWDEGGADYSTSTATQRNWKCQPCTGTVTFTNGSATLTGSGAAFTTQLAVGDWVIRVMGADTYASMMQIQSITDDNTATLTFPYQGGSGSSQYNAAGNYSPGDMGYIQLSLRRSFNTLCGTDYKAYDVFPHASCPTIDPSNFRNMRAKFVSGGGIYTEGALGNHTFGTMFSNMARALSDAEDDRRARFWATKTMCQYYHFYYQIYRSLWAGKTTAGQGYHSIRAALQVMASLNMMKNAFSDRPEYGDDLFYRNIFGASTAGIPQDASLIAGWEESSFSVGQIVGTVTPGLLAILSRPDMTEAANYRHYITNTWGTGSNYTQAALTTAEDYLHYAVLGNNPTIAPVAPTNTTTLLTATNRADCLTMNSENPTICGTEPRYGMLSRPVQAILWLFDASSFSRIDHYEQRPSVSTSVYMNGTALRAGDGNYFYANGRAFGNSVVSIGSDSNFIENNYVYGPVSINWAYGTSSLGETSADIKNLYLAGANVTSAHHSAAHLKSGSSTDYMFEQFHAVLTSPAAATWYQQMRLNGCGTPASSSCIAFTSGANGTIINTQPWGRLTTRVLNASLSTQNGGSDGGYTNQGGYNWRAGAVSSSATEHRMFVIHRATTSNSATMPNIVLSSAGTYRAIEVQDPTKPKMWLSAPGGVKTATSISAVTVSAANTQVAADGLAAGAWAFRVGGIAVSGCDSVVVLAGEHTANCDSVPTGTLTITQIGAGLGDGGFYRGSFRGLIK